MRHLILGRTKGPRLLAVRAQLQSEILESRQLLSTGLLPFVESSSSGLAVSPAASPSPPSTAFGPAQIRTAYGIDQIPAILSSDGTAHSVDGTGQTIAIVDAYNAPNIVDDLNTFDTQYPWLPPIDLHVVNQTGGSTLPTTDAGWALEISLDVEWAHAIAPGASILLVEANSASLGDLTAAVQYASQNASVVSMSWGGGEFGGEKTYDTSTFSAPGVVYVASSGDSGVPEWPSVSPNVVAVGGTTLTANLTTGDYGSETAWSGSGGGVSRFEKLPSYQSNAFGRYATGRTTPDVAYNANPSSGVAVYDSTPYQGSSGWYKIGGTSAGAPQWAAIFALADQARAAVSSTWPPLDSTSVPKGLYDLAYTLYQPPSTVYHDITSGNNAHYSAGTGYDLVTGLGSPIAQNLVQYLTTWSLPTSGSPSSPFTSASPSGQVQATAAVSPAAQVAPNVNVIVVTVAVQPPASRQVVIVLPIFAPTVPAPVALPATGAAAIPDTGTTTVVAPRPTQPLPRLSPSDARLVVPSDPEPEQSFTPDRDASALPAIEPSTPQPDSSLDTSAVPLSLLRAWDVAVSSIVDAGDGPALPAIPGPLPTETAPDLAHSALESTVMSGVAVALWGTWEVQTRRTDRRRSRAFLNFGK